MRLRTGSKRTNHVISALTARTQLGQILRRATQNNERFLVERRGEPQVIIMSLKDYVDSVASAPDWLKASWKDAERKGLNKLTTRRINAEIAAARRESCLVGPWLFCRPSRTSDTALRLMTSDVGKPEASF